MKKAQPHALPPENKSMRGYIAGLPPRFWRVLKDFDSYAEQNKNGYGRADYLRAGDVVLGGGSVHQTKVRVASPTKPTHYCLLGHGMMREYQNEGFIRPLTLPELLAAIPHMTNLIWYSEGQYALRNMLCSMMLFGTLENEVNAIISKYYQPC
jgi:hypothetical protein